MKTIKKPKNNLDIDKFINNVYYILYIYIHKMIKNISL